MYILGIESTCDETGIAIVEDGKEIIADIVASQHDIHSQYGGVFPELASRRHTEVIIPLIDQVLDKAQLTLKDIDAIAVAHGPGLMGALLVGVNCAKALSVSLNKPLIGVNHIEAHLYAALMDVETPEFPCLGIVLSGGHTSIVQINSLGDYELVGETHDDAVGEAFDKAAKVMGIPYPGGPKIEQLAKKGDRHAYPFKVGQIKKAPLHFSFSGIKTAVLYAVKGQNGKKEESKTLSESEICDIAASFQHAVFEDIIDKTLKAAEIKGCNTLIFGGGVTNNQTLRETFAKAAPNHTLLWPSKGLSLDNAAMIAGLGYIKAQQKCDSLYLEAQPRIPF